MAALAKPLDQVTWYGSDIHLGTDSASVAWPKDQWILWPGEAFGRVQVWCGARQVEQHLWGHVRGTYWCAFEGEWVRRISKIQTVCITDLWLVSSKGKTSEEDNKNEGNEGLIGDDQDRSIHLKGQVRHHTKAEGPIKCVGENCNGFFCRWCSWPSGTSSCSCARPVCQTWRPSSSPGSSSTTCPCMTFPGIFF